MKYLVIIVKGKNYGAYSPDVPGCVATDKNREKVEQRMQSALQAHIEWMIEDGDPLPVPHTSLDDPDIPHGPDYIPVYMDIRIPNVAA